MSASTSYMLTLPSRANQPRAAYNSFSFSFKYHSVSNAAAAAEAGLSGPAFLYLYSGKLFRQTESVLFQDTDKIRFLCIKSIQAPRVRILFPCQQDKQNKPLLPSINCLPAADLHNYRCTRHIDCIRPIMQKGNPNGTPFCI